MKRHADELSARARQSRTPLHTIQLQSIMESARRLTRPTTANLSEPNGCACSSGRVQERQKHCLAADNLSSVKPSASSRQSDGMNSDDLTRGSREISPEHLDGRNICESEVNCSGTCKTPSLRSHHTKMFWSNLSHQEEDKPFTTVAERIEPSILERTDHKFDSKNLLASAEVTPERSTSAYNSTAKRKLHLEDGKPKTSKRRKTTAGGGKKTAAMSDTLHAVSMKNSGQKTMQFYFRPA